MPHGQSAPFLAIRPQRVIHPLHQLGLKPQSMPPPFLLLVRWLPLSPLSKKKVSIPHCRSPSAGWAFAFWIVFCPMSMWYPPVFGSHWVYLVYRSTPWQQEKKGDLVLYSGDLFPTEARKPPSCPRSHSVNRKGKPTHPSAPLVDRCGFTKRLSTVHSRWSIKSFAATP